METLRKLCSVLQCSIRELVEETPSDTEDFRALAQDMALAFSGGKISEADRDAIFEIIQDAYEKSKAMNEKSSRKTMWSVEQIHQTAQSSSNNTEQGILLNLPLL